MRKTSLLACLVIVVSARFLVPVVASAPSGPAGLGPAAFDDEATARLTRHIDKLVALFPSAGTVAAADMRVDSLIAGNARDQLFRLESLLRLYRRQFPDLVKHLEQVKKVEDGLGAYEYAVESLKFAKDTFAQENQGQPPSAARKAEQQKVIDGLMKKQEAAHGVLAKLLEKSSLPADLPKLRSRVVSHFRGWDASKDLNYVKDEMQRMLTNVRDGSFNFNRLEDGIHEFRRRLRWFPLTIDSLDGLVVVRDDPAGMCPIPTLEGLGGTPVAKHKYANPSGGFPASHPCEISRCLLWPVAKTIRDIGHLKDEAQGQAAITSALEDIDIATSNKATPEEIARAKAIRSELFSSRALDSLIAQIGSCKSR